MATYQGHKNWNHWNVSLWINNDETLYRMAKNFIARYPNVGRSKQAGLMLQRLKDEGITHSAPYSVSSIRAAMLGM